MIASFDIIKAQSSEKQLRDQLLKNYDKSVRPVANFNDTIDLKLGLILRDIAKFDESTKKWSIVAWPKMEWTDSSLAWDPSQFGGISELMISSKLLWTPDISVFNSASERIFADQEVLAVVYSTGKVCLIPPAKFDLDCKMDFTYYPFDTQVCDVVFGSWAYDASKVLTTNSSEGVDVSFMNENIHWKVKSSSAESRIEKFDCCPEKYSYVSFKLHLKRRCMPPFFSVVLPTLGISLLAQIALCMSHESKKKLFFGIFVLIAEVAFATKTIKIIQFNANGCTPLITSYFAVLVAVSGLSVIFSALCCDHVNKSKVPCWLRCLTGCRANSCSSGKKDEEVDQWKSVAGAADNRLFHLLVFTMVAVLLTYLAHSGCCCSCWNSTVPQ